MTNETEAAPDMGFELEKVQSQQLKTLGPTEYALRKLRKEYAPENLPGNIVKGDDGYNQVHSAAMVIQKVRTGIEHRRKELKAGALKWGGLVDGEAKRLTALVVEIEEPWKLAKLAADQEQARKEQEAREVEQRRVAAIEEKVVGLQHAAEGLLNANSSAIQKRLDKVRGIVVSEDDYEEYYDAAVHHHQIAIEALTSALAAKVEQEELKAQLAEQEKQAALEREELDQLRREKAEREQAALAAEQAVESEKKGDVDLDERPEVEQREAEESLVPEPVDNTQELMDATRPREPVGEYVYRESDIIKAFQAVAADLPHGARPHISAEMLIAKLREICCDPA